MKTFLTIGLFLFASFMANAQSNIAHLNSQDVMAAMPSYNKAIQDLDKFQQELIEELEEMKKDFQKEAVIYQNMAAKGGSPTLIQIQEQKLIKMEAAIQERQQAMQGEIEAYSRELNYPIITKIETAVNIVADRHNYEYVFDVSTLMISNGPDMTQEVIAEVKKMKSPPPPPQENLNSIIPPPQEEIREVITRE